MSDDIKLEYFKELYKEYPELLDPQQVKEMLNNKIGTNKLYRLLKAKEIFNRKIGNNYIIPKICVIEYLMKN